MRALTTAAATAALALLALPAAALAQTSEPEEFKHGEANHRTYDGPIAFEQYSGGSERQAPCPPPGAPSCTYEAHDFTIDPGEVNGAFHVFVQWQDDANDWDLYVYRVRGDGTVDETRPIAQSASGGTTEETASLISIEEPIAPGTYRIYVDNWQSGTGNTDYDWTGRIDFEPWSPPNRGPAAAFTAPDTAVGGQAVTLDASGSTDDAGIANYAWDLDGDGRFETDAGTSPVHHAAFAPGRRHVTLRVRDAAAATAYATRTIDVSPAPAAPQQPAPPATDQPTLPPPPPARISLDLPSPQLLSAVLLRGVRASIECPSTCTIVANLRISAATARRLGLGRRGMTIATRTRTSTGRSFPRIRVKPGLRARRAMRRADAVSTTLQIRVTAEGHPPQTYTRPVSLTR